MMISIRNTCTISFLLLTCAVFAQRVAIGTSTAATSAVLDVTSTEKGILLPRMTSVERLMIVIPKPGLMLFDSTTFTYWYYDTQEWNEMYSNWIHNGDHIYNTNPGNVGIGMSNPTQVLHVLGTIRSLRPGSSPNGSSVSFDAPDGNPGIIFERGNGSVDPLRRWDLIIDDDQSLRIRDHSAGMDRLMIDVNGNVGIGTESPHASAALEIVSTTRGFLPPRMTEAQKNAIVSPVQGLMIWCTDCGDGQIQVYDGASWIEL